MSNEIDRQQLLSLGEFLDVGDPVDRYVSRRNLDAAFLCGIPEVCIHGCEARRSRAVDDPDAPQKRISFGAPPDAPIPISNDQS